MDISLKHFTQLLNKHTGDPKCTRKLFAGHCAEHANDFVQELDEIKQGVVDEINAGGYSKDGFRFPVES